MADQTTPPPATPAPRTSESLGMPDPSKPPEPQGNRIIDSRQPGQEHMRYSWGVEANDKFEKERALGAPYEVLKNMPRGISRAEANAELKLRGLPELPPPEPEKTPAQAAYDRMFQPAKSSEFYLPPSSNSIAPEFVAEDNKLRAKMQDFLEDAKFPRDIGSSTAQLAVQDMDQLAKLSLPSEKKAWAEKQDKQLRNVLGANYTAKVKVANDFIDSIERKRPGTRADLGRSGVLYSAQVVLQLIHQAERIMQRHGRFD